MKKLVLLSIVATAVAFAAPATFATFDLNKDGVITKDELLEVRANRQAAATASGGLMKNTANAPTFEMIDANKDGKITPTEFVNMRGKGMGKGAGTGQGMGVGMGKGAGTGMGAGAGNGGGKGK